MQNQNAFPSPITLDGYQRISGTCSDFDQIRVDTGNLLRSVSLFNIPTVGAPLRFELTYNALDNFFSGAVGARWRHCWMVNLTFTPPVGNHSGATYTDETGRQTDFIYDSDSAAWQLSDNSYFEPYILSQNDSGLWSLKTYPHGLIQNFVELGGGQSRIVSQYDASGNHIDFIYSGTFLSSITSGARSITFTPNSAGLIESATDPNGNVVHFEYELDTTDSYYNLTKICNPEGCILTYTYYPDHLIETRVDQVGNAYTFTYDSLGRVSTVQDSESPVHTLTYSYGTVTEYTGDSDTHVFQQTLLIDAEGQTWDYRFDKGSRLWRVIDPLQHTKHFYWSDQDQLISASEAYQYHLGTDLASLGPRDNNNNIYRRAVYDTRGHLQMEGDANGIITQYEYDDDDQIIGVVPGRATLAVQGDWIGKFGADGYILCAFNTDASDVENLPSYVSSITNGEDGIGTFGYAAYNDLNPATSPTYSAFDRTKIIDPRVPISKVPEEADRISYRRAIGYWQKSTSEARKFFFQLNILESTHFDLSFYSNSTEQGMLSAAPFLYYEQFGRDMEILVNDTDPLTLEPRTQAFRMISNSGGVWTTFSVYAPAGGNVQVLVRGRALCENPAISAICFDPYNNRRSEIGYDNLGRVTQQIDPLGRSNFMSYNSNGTLGTMTDALSRVTQFAYEDANLNLTKIIDANAPVAGTTLMAYDSNSNLLSVVDPESKTTHFTYDGLNRVKTILDALSGLTQISYDPRGGVSQVTDALGNTTRFTYTNCNRIYQIIDAQNNTTTLTYYPSGRLHTMTDGRGNVTTLSYDIAGRLQEVLQPDTNQVRYAFNALHRLVSVTTPNGNLSEPNDINLLGAANHLKNPSFEERDPFFNIYGTESTRFWEAMSGYYHTPSPRDGSMAHRGAYSIHLTRLRQNKIAAYQGGRYLTNYWTKKDLDGISSSSWADFSYRDFQGNLQTLSGETTSAQTLDGTDPNWILANAMRIDLPADSQTTLTNPALETLAFNSSPATTRQNIDDVGLYNLSTCFEYDGENLREVGTPDGARRRTEYDRLGRMIAMTDPLGRSTLLSYDGLDRVVAVTDAQGLSVKFTYDEVGNLTVFTDANLQNTSYDYDNLDRLKLITYSDSTIEAFTYTAAGDLHTYQDNQGRTRTMSYDALHRLTGVTFSDSTTMSISYDAVGNLQTLQDRGGNTFRYFYDSLYRPVANQALQGSTTLWSQSSTFDANSNRTALSTDPPVYGSATFGTDRYLVGTPHWSVPAGGYDAMDRLHEFNDRNGNATVMDYDVESRRSQIQYPNGSLTSAIYDIVGRLVQLNTSKSESPLLSLTYGYTAASERVGQFVNSPTQNDSYDYELDNSGRLVSETINRMVHRSAQHFLQGEYDHCHWNDSDGRMELLTFADSFGGTSMNTDRWKVYNQFNSLENTIVGQECHQNDGLHLVFPRGYTSQSLGNRSVSDNYGLNSGDTEIHLSHSISLTGDFDIETSFSDFNSVGHIGKLKMTLDVNDPTQPQGDFFEVSRYTSYYGTTSDNEHYCLAISGGTPSLVTETAPNLESGKLRIQRVGSTLTAYYYSTSTSSWVTPSGWNTTSFGTQPLYLSLGAYMQGETLLTGRFFDLKYTDSGPAYPTTATYGSNIYDAGSTVNLNQLSWDQNVPSGTGLSFQIATSSSPAGPWTFVGPDGTAATSWTSSPATLPTSPHPSGRYFRYQATLTSTAGTATPGFSNVQISFSGTGSNTSTLMVYAYDNAGNITSKTTVTDSGTATDVRTPNSLNQITTQVVGGVTWTYTWNADGTLASKAGGGNTWAYTWDDVDGQRLLNVKLNSVTQIAFTYDTMGRMLTRTPYSGGVASGTTTFTWDGRDCIKESSSTSTTRYYCPQGELQSFERDGVTYQCHNDGLGSCRLVTNASGAVVANFSYDAWGNLLSTSTDSVPGGMPFKFVGALGCRTDATAGLIYMRQRWYDPQLQRFISRDPIGLSGGLNLYAYCANDPTNYVDPLGLQYGWSPSANVNGPSSADPFIRKLLKNIRSRNALGRALMESLDCDTGLQISFAKDMARTWGGEFGLYDSGTGQIFIQSQLLDKYEQERRFGSPQLAQNYALLIEGVIVHELTHAYQFRHQDAVKNWDTLAPNGLPMWSYYELEAWVASGNYLNSVDPQFRLTFPPSALTKASDKCRDNCGNSQSRSELLRDIYRSYTKAGIQ